MSCIGYIYIATSPLLNAIKIGGSTSPIQRVYNRYCVSYGNETTINMFSSGDVWTHESVIHSLLKPYQISGEIYRKECLEKALELCKVIVNDEMFVYKPKRKKMRWNRANIVFENEENKEKVKNIRIPLNRERVKGLI